MILGLAKSIALTKNLP